MKDTRLQVPIVWQNQKEEQAFEMTVSQKRFDIPESSTYQ